MNIQEISTFLAVCKYGAFSKAAEQLYMTQPTVSWYISALEKELGHQLFIRKRGQKRIIMTDAGKIFYQQAVKWEALWNETQTLLSQKTYTKFNFACAHSISHHMIPFIHSWFKEHMPDYAISTSVRPSVAIVNGVESKDFDAGLSILPPTTNRASAIPIASERLVFVCRVDSDYPDYVNVRNLDYRNYICLTWTDEQKEWREKNFHGRPYAELNSFDDLMYFFESPKIWTILPYTLWFYMQDQLRICEMDHALNDRMFYLVTATPSKEDLTEPLAKALHEFFSQYGEGVTLF